MATQPSTNNKIIFWDPNDSMGEGLVHHPEDLSISVQLLVTVPEEKGETDGKYFCIEWVPSEKKNAGKLISFFSGKNVGGLNVLTDFYSDVSYNSSKDGNIQEALGISSINIEYDSWYLPQITINFIDIRGLSLMNPAQYAYNVQSKVAGSFFKALFTIPYPLFKLQVKGFYGDAVTYDLQCWDVRSTLNADTGNVDIVAKFVGYTYAFFADVQFDFIKSAPFNKYGGETYWAEQVNNGRFKLDGTVPIPNLPELEHTIQVTVAMAEKLETDADLKDYNVANNGLDLLNAAYVTFENYIIQCNKFVSNRILGGNRDTENIVKYYVPSVSELENLLNGDKEYQDSLKSLKDAINVYNTSEAGTKISSLVFPGDSEANCGIINHGELTKIDVEEAYRIVSVGGKEEKILNQDILSLDYSNFITSRTKARDLIDKTRTDGALASQSKLDAVMEKNVTFRPTIKNILKIFFAHFETFFQDYFKCIDYINTNPRNGSNPKFRGIIDVENQTLLNTHTGNIDLPPFFHIFMKDDKKTETWIGDDNIGVINKEDFEEVKYITLYTDSLTAYGKREDELGASSNMSYDDTFWFPINPFDISAKIVNNGVHLNNPYNVFKTSDANSDFYNVVTQIGIRMFFGLSTYDGKKLSDEIIKAISKAEALNIYNILGNNKDMMAHFKLDTVSNEILALLQGNRDSNNKFLIDINIDQKLSGVTDKSDVFHPLARVFSSSTGGNYVYDFIVGKSNIDFSVLPLFSALVGDYNANEQIKVVSKGQANYNAGVPLLVNKETTWSGAKNAFFSIQKYTKDIDRLKDKVSTEDADIGHTLVGLWFLGVDDSVSLFNSNLPTVSSYKNKAKLMEGDNSYRTIPMITDENRTKSTSISNAFLNLSTSAIQFYESGQNLDVTLKELRNSDYSSYILQNISFIDNKGNIRSLFGDKIYYLQNNKLLLNNFTDKDEQERSICAKAALFVNCLGIDIEKLNSLIGNINNPSIIRIPKIAILLIGSYLWRSKFEIYKGIDPITTDKDDVIKTGGATNTLLFKGDDTTKVFSNIYTSIRANLIPGWNFTDFLKRDTTYTFKFRTSVVDIIIDYFQNWAINEYPLIEKNFRLFDVGGNFNISYDSFGTTDSITTAQIQTIFGVDIFNSYNFIIKTNSNSNYKGFVLINKIGSDGVNLLMDLYKQDVLLINTYFDIFNYDNDKNIKPGIKFEISTSYVTSYLTNLSEELRKLLGVSQPDVKKNEDPSLPIKTPSNKDANIEKYQKFRLLYDKWCRKPTTKNDFLMEVYLGRQDGTPPAGLNNIMEGSIKIIDKFYRDISDEYIVNLEILKNILELVKGNPNFTFLSFLSKLFSDLQMMFIPTPNSIDFTKVENLQKMFEPIPYRNKTWVKQFPSYTAIYTGKPSEIPDDGTTNFKSDALHIYRDNGQTVCNAPGANNGTYHLPCFAVSYGKQNQSYFKIAQLTNTNPTITEQSINAQLEIAHTSVESGTQKMNSGQSLYSIYASNAYMVEIEMMGCAQIQPLMYFQLFNVYLFTGAYMIFKMSHNITPGRMVTRFTGIRQSTIYPYMSTQAFSFQNVIGKDGSNLGEFIQSVDYKYNAYATSGAKSNIDIQKEYRRFGGIYGPSSIAIKDDNYVSESLMDVKIGKYYTLYEMIATMMSNTGSVRTTARRQMPKEIYDHYVVFIPYLDKVRDYIKTTWGDDHNLRLHSVWRHRDNGNTSTFHGYGKAADFTVFKNGMSGADFVAKNNTLYEYLRTQFPDRGHISELLKEGATGEFTTDYRGWIHMAIIGFDYPNKPIVCSAYAKNSKCIEGKYYRIT